MKSLKEFFTGIERKRETIALKDFSSHPHGHEHQAQLPNRYQCPMKCEGEKTYDSPGICPVCNMKLVPVRETGSHSHGHGHQGYGHHHCC